MTVDPELQRYLASLSLEATTNVRGKNGTIEGLRTLPLFSWSVRQAVKAQCANEGTQDFQQFGLLGHEPKGSAADEKHFGKDTSNVDPIFLNTNAPWSAFICGSQGSGKSHTLSCMLENCLLPQDKIQNLGKLQKSLTGIVFHYGARSSDSVREAAHLCTAGIPVNLLVSPSNLPRMQSLYSKALGSHDNLSIYACRFEPSHLNAERMMSLMALSDKEGGVPLYMEVIIQILRQMASTMSSTGSINYGDFKNRLDKAGLSKDQSGPMNLRLQLLEDFMNLEKPGKTNLFQPKSGTLTIVDLTDPFIGEAMACVLFDICLALFLEDKSNKSHVIALDEAHKFMNRSTAAENFTESLLSVIRLQRHEGARIIVATQEPTVSPKLLDLCSMTFVHRFTSPDWFATLKSHLAGVSTIAGPSEQDSREVFAKIVTLEVGEALLFSPSAALRVINGKIQKLGLDYVRFKTRPRVSADGGKSVLAIE